MEKQSTYHEIEQDLLKTNAFIEAAEAHGIMCGFICAGATSNDRHWLETILNPIIADDDKQLKSLTNIIDLYEQTVIAIQAMDLELVLLLPDDNQDLSIRAKALTDWCRGFLSGIALGSGTLNHTNADIQEIIMDLKAISKLDSRDIGDSNQEEEQFFELAEHVRMSTLLLHTLLQAPNELKPH